MVLSVEMVAALTGVTSALGVIALASYLYLVQRIKALEGSEFKSVRQIVEGDEIFNADQVIHILKTFDGDTARLAALKELAKVQKRSADRATNVYKKIKSGISVTELQKQRYMHIRRLTMGVAPFFFLIGFMSVSYGAYSNPEVRSAIKEFALRILGRPGPEPLSIVPRPPVATAGGSADMALTDLDPVKVEWDSKGETENVSVFLENVDTNRRTAKKTVLSDVRSVNFWADELHEVASNRQYQGKNRVRTVVEWSDHLDSHMARSDIVDILVGIRFRLMIGGTLITPQGKRSINTLVATIDDSTEQMPPGYCFTVDFAGWSLSGSSLVAPLKACNSKLEVNLPFLQQVEWNRPPGLVLDQPLADRPTARLCIAAPQHPDHNC